MHLLTYTQKMCFDRAIVRREDFTVAADFDKTTMRIGNTMFADQKRHGYVNMQTIQRSSGVFRRDLGCRVALVSPRYRRDGEVFNTQLYNINQMKRHWFIKGGLWPGPLPPKIVSGSPE